MDNRVVQVPIKGVNSYIIKGEKNIIVDTGNPGSEQIIHDKLTELGIKPSDISLIVLTHGHSDHFGSASALKEKTGAKVAVHKLDADYIRKGKNPDFKARNLTGKLFALTLKKEVPGFTPFEPDVIVDKNLPLKDYGVDGEIIPTPGHTMGSLSVVLASGQAIVGDLVSGGFFQQGIPQYSAYIDDMEAAKNSLNSVMKLSPKIIFAGHGGPFSPDSVNKILSK